MQQQPAGWGTACRACKEAGHPGSNPGHGPSWPRPGEGRPTATEEGCISGTGWVCAPRDVVPGCFMQGLQPLLFCRSCRKSSRDGRGRPPSWTASSRVRSRKQCRRRSLHPSRPESRKQRRLLPSRPQVLCRCSFPLLLTQPLLVPAWFNALRMGCAGGPSLEVIGGLGAVGLIGAATVANNNKTGGSPAASKVSPCFPHGGEPRQLQAHSTRDLTADVLPVAEGAPKAWSGHAEDRAPGKAGSEEGSVRWHRVLWHSEGWRSTEGGQGSTCSAEGG